MRCDHHRHADGFDFVGSRPWSWRVVVWRATTTSHCTRTHRRRARARILGILFPSGRYLPYPARRKTRPETSRCSQPIDGLSQLSKKFQAYPYPPPDCVQVSVVRLATIVPLRSATSFSTPDFFCDSSYVSAQDLEFY